jgi:EAL domain-containing protein (putative c-di-GMP-specific phosphodiesterase class I)/FixJ family two-component response regulator
VSKIAELSFLVVEDEDFQRKMLVELLKHSNARKVYSASNGQEAVDVLVRDPVSVDIVICDLRMPVMDGLEFLRRAGELGYRGSVLIASALDRTLLAAAEAMSKAYGINLLGAVSKPVTQQMLETATARHGVAQPKVHARPAPRRVFTPDEIIQGLEHDEFEPFFQPKVDLATGRVIGCEALARWRHPEHGLIPPAAFVKILEVAGKVDDLMWVVLRKAIVFCGTLNTTGVESSVAVNLSLKSLNNVELAGRVAATVERHNLDPRKVCLEITESAATTNLGAALENLTRLRMAGFGLSIDDFGTGYSSMEQLTRIPFTELKIDRSFVSNAATHEPARVMLTSCLQIARQLKLKAVAEGVETQQEWDLLQELGCDLAQGYFIAKPMEASAYLTWLQNLTTTPNSIFTTSILSASAKRRQ